MTNIDFQALRASRDETIVKFIKRGSSPAEASQSADAIMRAEALGIVIDPVLDHQEWLAEHAKLTLPYMELAHPSLLESLPLQTAGYPKTLRVDVISAAMRALDATYSPAPEHIPTYPVIAENLRPLPQGAPRLFGLTGKPQSGKDVVADYVQANYQGVERFAFSGGIIDEANAWLAAVGSPHVIVEGNKSQPHFRFLLQAFGMGRREEDPNYWTKQVAKRIRQAWDYGARLVIVTGARMPTDLEVIEENGGRMWRAVRPGNPYQYASGAAAAVESGLDGYPDSAFVTVLNPVEGDLAPYEANIRRALTISSSS